MTSGDGSTSPDEGAGALDPEAPSEDEAVASVASVGAEEVEAPASEAPDVPSPVPERVEVSSLDETVVSEGVEVPGSESAVAPGVEAPASAVDVPIPDGLLTPPPEPDIPPADAVIPPAPPEVPIPDGLLAPPPEFDIPPADAVIPPPPPEARLRSERSRPKPAILDGEQPAAVADDWAQRSIAPEVPTTGSYRGFAVVVFGFLFLLLIGAVVVGVYLVATTGLPFAGVDAGFAPLLLEL